MTGLKPGTRVHVEFDATVTEFADTYLRVAAGPTAYVYFFRRENVVVTALPPENWPPQVGDTWQAGEDLYYVRAWVGSGGTLVVANFTSEGCAFSDGYGPCALDKFKELSPVLLFRPEVSS
jgi:hypothetical protein